MEYLKEKFWSGQGLRYKYKFETVGDEETKFVMISGDPLDIEVKLNNLAREPRKFICLNDNIDYKLENEALKLKELLANFYSMLFPLKSSFELGGGFREEVKKEEINNIFILLILVGIFILIFYFLRMFFKFVFARFGKKRSRNKVIKSKREYKVSNALRQKMQQEMAEATTDSSSESMVNENSVVVNSSSSVGIFMRSKHVKNSPGQINSTKRGIKKQIGANNI